MNDRILRATPGGSSWVLKTYRFRDLRFRILDETISKYPFYLGKKKKKKKPCNSWIRHERCKNDDILQIKNS